MHWARNDIITAYEMGLIDAWPDTPDAPAPRRLTARLMANGLGLAPVQGPPRFADLAADDPDNDWFTALYDEGILRGGDDGAMLPESALSRAELAAIVARAAAPILAPQRSAMSFSDLEGHWAAGEVSVACELGLVQGVGDGLYEPDRSVTLAELLTVLVRMVQGDPSPTAALPSEEALAELAATDLREWARAYSQNPQPDWGPLYANRVGVGLFIIKETAVIESVYRSRGHTGAAVIESLTAKTITRRPLSAIVELDSTGDSVWDGVTTEIVSRNHVFIRLYEGRWVVYKSLPVQQ